MAASVTLFQQEMAALSGHIYSRRSSMVEKEWRAFANTQGLYSSRVDIAVGPFSIVRGGNCIIFHDAVLEFSQQFIQRLIYHHTDNVNKYRHADDPRIDNALQLPTMEGLRTFNRNARCFLAIEIENEVTRKQPFRWGG
jgi:hypothetical protein